MKSALKTSTYRFALALSCVMITGCLRTQIESQALQPKVFELAAINRNPMRLDVQSKQDARLGHQFMLIGIPFGAVESTDLALMVQRATYRKLALRGFTPLVGQRVTPQGIQPNAVPWGPAAPGLSITVEQATASAFDFLVTRRLSCTLELSARLSNRGSEQLAHSSGSFEHFGAFAFERELTLCLAQALDVALEDAMETLRIQG